MRKGLTISELLVAMAIIGVIAVLVIPGFLKDYHKKLYTTQLKKTYGMIYSAIEQACGDYNVTAFSQTPYFTATASTEKQGEFLDKYFKVVKPADASITDKFTPKYRSLTNTDKDENISIESDAAKATLKSGESIGLYCFSDTTEPKHRCYVTLDINATEGPNIGGRDMFRFTIDADNNELYGATGWTQCQPDNTSTPTGDQGGHGCLARIMKDNWEMKY